MANREIRHPYQIMDIDELIVGQTYVFVNYYQRHKTPYVCDYIFGGIIKDSGNADETVKASNFVVLPDLTKGIVTIHLDGWSSQYSITKRNSPTLVYWRLNNNRFDNLDTYLGQPPSVKIEDTPIVVLKQHWEDDPHIHFNITERKIKFSPVSEVPDAASWEQRMRQKKHDAMKRAFGF